MDMGVVIGGDLREQAQLAREVEQAGFESAWVAETARSSFVQAAVACAATSRVTVGTDIALAFPRSPTITAMSARDLAELSGGRFILGLGTQVKRVNEQRFGVAFEHPAPKIAEAVEAIRAVLRTFAGHPIEHEGRFYSITMPPFPGAGPAPGGVPIYLAAVNRVMAETAKFGQPEILLGIIPGGGGTQRLTRLVGPSRAKDIILSGRQVGAEEALRIGLADRAVPAESVFETALAWAAELARGPLVAHSLAKRAIDEGLDGPLADGIALEQELFAEVFASEDAQIGVKSFLENGPGKATFTGR